MERVPVAAGTVVLIKVRMLPLAASPGKGQGIARTRRKVLYHLHQRDKRVICAGQVIQSRVHTCFNSTRWYHQ